MGCLFTYQKSNGEVFMRTSKYDYGRHIGDETSMGWKVLNIHYEYKGNYYLRDDLMKTLRREKIMEKRKPIKIFIVNKLTNLVDNMKRSIYY